MDGMDIQITNLRSTAVDTPDGVFTIIAGSAGVLASGWTEEASALIALINPQLRAVANSDDSASGVILTEAADAVRAYYAGDATAPGTVTVHQRSGEFRQHAWEVLRRVEPGAAITYAEYAARAGNPKAVRAAAGACAMNAAALFVPCHRIIRTDGTLGGFRYGLPIKQSLLERERFLI